MIHLHSLGQCMITLTAARVLPTARLLFASALYVAVEGTKSIAREQMATMLWPEMTEERATHALRQIFYRLRAHGLQLDGDAKEVSVPATTIHRDYDALLAAEGSGVTEGLLERIPGGFLPGYMPTVSAPFAEWVEVQRARVNASLRRQLVTGITAQRAAGNWASTQALAQRCLEIDPLNEEATLAYAEAMAMDGSKALAIMQIDRYLSEIGPRAKELHLPATMLRKRISELYPLPPVIERDPPHTGRDAEMARLDAAMVEVRQGHGRAFLISGPPGIGKTRLATEFTRAARLQGLRVARTAMGRHDDHRPLGAWCDLVRELRRMPGALGCDPESVPFLDRLTSGTSGDSAAREEERDAEYLFARIRMAIVDLVCAVASESVLILWIEDVHWMDEWSWDVMSALTKKLEKTGVLVLVTRRESDEEGTAVPAEARLERMELGPLDDAGCRRLLALVDTRPKRADGEFADWCVRTCTGNPYFLIELARRASRGDGRFLAPPSLMRLIAERFEEVAPLSRRVLQAAAVLGRNSTLPRIEGVLDERRVSLLASLDELTAHALLIAEGDRVVCRHDLLGMSALSGVSELSLKLLHRHAGRVLESEIDAGSSPDFMWDCAEHWEKAGERERALELVEKCARRAIEIGAPGEAVRALRIALQWSTSAERHDLLQRTLLRALYLTGDDWGAKTVGEDRAKSGALTAASFASHSDEELYELDARHFTGGADLQLLDRLIHCASTAEASPNHRVEAAIIAAKMAADHFCPDAARLAREGASAVSLLAARDLVNELAVVYEGQFGSHAECSRAARQLRGAKDSSMSPARRIRALRLCTFGLFVSGHIDEARDCAAGIVEASEAQNLTATLAFTLQTFVRIHLALGELSSVPPLLERLSGDEFRSVLAREESRLLYPARFALLANDDETAIPLIAELRATYPAICPRKQLHDTALEIIPRIRSQGYRPSDTDMNDLIAQHRAGRAFGSHDFFVYALTYAFEARGDTRGAAELYSEYVSKYRREAFPVLPQLRERISAFD